MGLDLDLGLKSHIRTFHLLLLPAGARADGPQSNSLDLGSGSSPLMRMKTMSLNLRGRSPTLNRPGSPFHNDVPVSPVSNASSSLPRTSSALRWMLGKMKMNIDMNRRMTGSDVPDQNPSLMGRDMRPSVGTSVSGSHFRGRSSTSLRAFKLQDLDKRVPPTF